MDRYLIQYAPVSEEQGSDRADDERLGPPNSLFRENWATHIEAQSFDAWFYCYVERESVHALIVSTYTSPNLLITLRRYISRR